MSVFALAGPRMLDRHGPDRIVLGCLVLIALGTGLRAVMPTGFLLLLMTVPIGVGMGLAGVSLPAVVKRSFRSSPGRITGWYVAAMALGAAAAAYAIGPMSDALGSWRAAFVATGAFALAAVPFWVLPSSQAVATRSADRLKFPSRSELRLGLIFGAASLGFTGTITWVAAIYIESGWTIAAAGAATGAVMLVSIPSSVLLPGLSDGGRRGAWTAAAAIVMSLGILGFALAPTLAPALWIAVFAIGNGVYFPLVLTLPLDAGGTPQAVRQGVTWTMAIGFLLGSLAPLIVGALRDLSGSFVLPMVLLAGISASGGLLALTISGGGQIDRAQAP